MLLQIVGTLVKSFGIVCPVCTPGQKSLFENSSCNREVFQMMKHHICSRFWNGSIWKVVFYRSIYLLPYLGSNSNISRFGKVDYPLKLTYTCTYSKMKQPTTEDCSVPRSSFLLDNDTEC